MGNKSRFKVKLQKENKRRKKRIKLAKEGKKVADLFSSGTWVGSRKKTTAN